LDGRVIAFIALALPPVSLLLVKNLHEPRSHIRVLFFLEVLNVLQLFRLGVESFLLVPGSEVVTAPGSVGWLLSPR
jgi:hypothetical protein